MLIATFNATTEWLGRTITREGDVCPECNAAFTRPGSQPRGRLGNVYQVRRGLAKKPAIVVAESGEMLTLHVSRGATMERVHQSHKSQ